MYPLGEPYAGKEETSISLKEWKSEEIINFHLILDFHTLRLLRIQGML